MSQHTIKVNGMNKVVYVDDDTPLLWVLRDNLDLTGTKYGCGEGYCGSCTVHIDGQAEKSCSVTIKEANRKSITTIEGLAEDKNNPIIKTWIDLEVSQCGYCQPGQIMTLAALLNNNPNPSRDEINDTMSGVLCRCGTYYRIRKAINKIVKEA